MRTAAAAPGPITLRVGDRAWSLLALEPLERLEMAVPVGVSQVRLLAPEGTRAWTNLTPATQSGIGAADLRRYWPLVEEEHSLRYELPDPGVPGPVRVALRVLDPRVGEPVKVALRADAGDRRTLELVPGPADAVSYTHLTLPTSDLV